MCLHLLVAGTQKRWHTGRGGTLEKVAGTWKEQYISLSVYVDNLHSISRGEGYIGIGHNGLSVCLCPCIRAVLLSPRMMIMHFYLWPKSSHSGPENSPCTCCHIVCAAYAAHKLLSCTCCHITSNSRVSWSRYASHHLWQKWPTFLAPINNPMLPEC